MNRVIWSVRLEFRLAKLMNGTNSWEAYFLKWRLGFTSGRKHETWHDGVFWPPLSYWKGRGMLSSLGCCKMQHLWPDFVANCHISKSVGGIWTKFLMKHHLWKADTPAKFEVAAETGRVAASCRKLGYFAASFFFSSKENEIKIKQYVRCPSCL